MAQSVSEQDMASAFMDWANTFKLSRPVVKIKWFKLSSGEAREDNWVNNFNKLRRLFLLLTHELYSLIVTLTVNNANKETNLEKNYTIKRNFARGVEVMKRLGESTVEAPPKMNSDNLIVAQKEALEKAHQALMEEHIALRDQCDDLQAELDRFSSFYSDDLILKANNDRLQNELQA
ncbi:19695_t:CDS:2 [Funneliformis geosporum]|uniref:19695_t:CDS:1 n=1 Tax=Funneliformis geosporum TaxID=1117311 RepID=A0A9W4SYN6_9GLOM|nr:19695_t:CDS:2 [Funneliformis geosporum]